MGDDKGADGFLSVFIVIDLEYFFYSFKKIVMLFFRDIDFFGWKTTRSFCV